jgi:sugar (pentulose or hexulose) kinase
MMTPDHTFEFTLENKHLKIGIGVHDSSAALMPYHVSMREPFLLLSTGTWNITFNPFNQEPLCETELAKDCLCYLTYQGKPVKASRIFLGHEHEVQQKALAMFFGRGPDDYKRIVFDESIYQELAREHSETKTFYPLAMEGTGPIPEKQSLRTDFTKFSTFEEAYHQFLRYLVQWQKISIDLVDPARSVKNIIVVGGFTKNPLFLEIMKRELKDRKILLSEHPRASALGAAWLVHDREAYASETHVLKVLTA